MKIRHSIEMIGFTDTSDLMIIDGGSFQGNIHDCFHGLVGMVSTRHPCITEKSRRVENIHIQRQNGVLQR